VRSVLNHIKSAVVSQVLVGALLLIAAAGVRLADPDLLQALRLAYFDQLQRLSPRDYAELPVKVIDIDEASLAQIGQWPWPRNRLADMVQTLGDHGVAAVAFDVIFAEDDRLSPARVLEQGNLPFELADGVTPDLINALDFDAQFARAMATMPVVLGTSEVIDTGAVAPSPRIGVVEIGERPSEAFYPTRALTPIVPALADAATGIGVINISPGDLAQVVRRVPMAWQTSKGPMPALALELLRAGLGESTLIVQGIADLDAAILQLRLADFTMPTTARGEMWFHARHEDSRSYVSAAEVLSVPKGTVNPDLMDKLSGNLVLVGTSAAGLLDIRTTPLGQAVPGVSIHAQILEQILLGAYLTRNDVVEGAEMLAFLIIGLAVIILAVRTGPMVSLIVGGASGAVLVIGSWLAFTRTGILLDVTFPLAGGLFAFGNLLAWQYVVADREKRLIRRSFSHYVAPTVLEQIERSGHSLKLGGEIRPLSVMFCDIRGFTSLSETLSAPDLVNMLNRLFDRLGAEILEQRGTIDKFIGDAIMAFWNAPIDIEDHAERACLAALGMRKALADLNSVKTSVPVDICIGISTGIGCVGNMGSSDRYNYSVVGDTVNVAARVEAECRPIGYDIVVAQDTAVGAKRLALLDAGSVTLKGKTARTPVSILVGDEALANSDAFIELAGRHAAFIQGLSKDSDCSEVSAIAAQIEPGLVEFYDRILDRPDDFR